MTNSRNCAASGLLAGAVHGGFEEGRSAIRRGQQQGAKTQSEADRRVEFVRSRFGIGIFRVCLWDRDWG
jgi:hypothetical protein